MNSVRRNSEGKTMRRENPFSLFSGDEPCVIVVSPDEPGYVRLAAKDLADDVFKVSGGRIRCVGSIPPGRKGNYISVATVPLEFDSVWENFRIASKKGNILELHGSSSRGTMFAVYRFAERFLGIDPFYHWTDSEPRKNPDPAWEDVYVEQKTPSYKFRGLFLNDHDLIEKWSGKKGGSRHEDFPYYSDVSTPEIVAMIAETAVRAGYNLLIPESHVRITNPAEKRLLDEASKRGLFLTMHHIEPLGVSSFTFADYWGKRGKQYSFSYVENPEAFHEIWRDFAGMWARYPDVIWQLGLRGVADRPFWLASDCPLKTDKERADLISSAMEKQLEIITEVLGKRPEFYSATLWAEGAYFNTKNLLRIPEGSIVVFSDNCAGWRMQKDFYSTKRDEKHKYGIYYHHGITCGNHLAQLVPPERTCQVLREAAGLKSSEYAIFNTANIREVVLGLKASSEMCWNIGTFDAEEFMNRWVSAHFSAMHEEILNAYRTYFNAYEFHPEAEVALFNDGLMTWRMTELFRLFDSWKEAAPVKETSHFAVPKRLFTPVRTSDPFWNSLSDMAPRINSDREMCKLLSAQNTGFEFVLEQLEGFESRLPENEWRFLFSQLVFTSRYVLHVGRSLQQLYFAADALRRGNRKQFRRHVLGAKKEMEEACKAIEENSYGRWKNWYRGNRIVRHSTLQTRTGKCFLECGRDSLMESIDRIMEGAWKRKTG